MIAILEYINTSDITEVYDRVTSDHLPFIYLIVFSMIILGTAVWPMYSLLIL